METQPYKIRGYLSKFSMQQIINYLKTINGFDLAHFVASGIIDLFAGNVTETKSRKHCFIQAIK